MAGLPASVGLVITAFARVLGLVALAAMAGILYVVPEHEAEDQEALDAAHDMEAELVPPRPQQESSGGST